MTRHRWLQAEWPNPVRTLAKRVRQHSFSDEERSGFIVDRVRDEFLEARYVERYEFEETVSDPFGKELTLSRLEFRQTAFRASPGWPGLELIDAPRSIQTFVSELLQATDFSLPITPIFVDVMRWVDAFQEVTNTSVVIGSAQIGALQLEDGVQAKAVLKGEKDVRDACKNLTRGRPHVLEKLQFRVTQGSATATVLFANNATAKVEGRDLQDELLHVIRRALPAPT